MPQPAVQYGARARAIGNTPRHAGMFGTQCGLGLYCGKMSARLGVGCGKMSVQLSTTICNPYNQCGARLKASMRTLRWMPVPQHTPVTVPLGSTVDTSPEYSITNKMGGLKKHSSGFETCFALHPAPSVLGSSENILKSRRLAPF